MTGSALNGIRVLELGGGDSYAVPYATRLLADLGAEVVMVEPPEGHALRRVPGAEGRDAHARRNVFSFLAGGKRSVVLPDPHHRSLGELLSWAEVVVDDLGVDGLAALGFDDDELRRLRPDSVTVHVSDWGDSGPYRDLPATALTLQATAGWVTTRNEPGAPLVQVGGRMHEWVAGAFIAAAVMTGRAAVRKTGIGVCVDFSVFECIHSTIPYTRLQLDTNVELGLGPTVTVFTPFGVRPCKDGWVGINILTGRQWVDACLVTDLGEFADQQQELGRGEGEIARFESRLLKWLSRRTVKEVVELGQAMRIPVVPVCPGGSVDLLPQWTQREFFVEVDGSDGTYMCPGPPWRLGATPPHRGLRAPVLGEHTAGMLDDLDQVAGSKR
ncbi:hypothetical protein GCM10009609_33350 [Pseudonocardia aurantiaca]|uniref:CoA transferase n=1 Tax=Pseudonocardia aurantiaca TaxID=75290 RepID=A0ABW4FUM2_9PSEU